MTKPLFITSDTVLFNCIAQELKLKQITPLLYEGKCNKREMALLQVKNSKIDSSISLVHLLSKTEYSKLIVINPIQCPDINIPMGQIIIAENVTEWDKSIVESRIIPLQTLDFETKVVKGKGMSGDRDCTNKSTPILQSKLIDTITFPVSKVAEYFNVPVLSIGIVADYCTLNYRKLLQSNIKELSSRMLDFLKSNFSILLGN
jgi:hypothetical protein